MNEISPPFKQSAPPIVDPQNEAFSQMIVEAANREHYLRTALIAETRRANQAEERMINPISLEKELQNGRDSLTEATTMITKLVRERDAAKDEAETWCKRFTERGLELDAVRTDLSNARNVSAG